MGGDFRTIRKSEYERKDKKYLHQEGIQSKAMLLKHKKVLILREGIKTRTLDVNHGVSLNTDSRISEPLPLLLVCNHCITNEVF